MTDSEQLDFLIRTRADVGYRDGLWAVLIWGEPYGVRCVVVSAHDPDLRAAVETAAHRMVHGIEEAA